MAGGVSGYAAMNAQVRVLYSYLLTPAELADLGESADLGALIALLKRTAYGPYLDAIKEKEPTPPAVLLQLKRRLVETHQSVIHSALGQARRVLLQFYRGYEINNLKAVLRGIAIGTARRVDAPLWPGVRDLLYPLGSMTVLLAEAMVESGSVAAAVELLRGTPYFDVLSAALKRYTAEQSLFPLEVALDLSYWRRVWQEARKLAGDDQRQALRVLGALVDTNNLMWAIRYRVYQRLSEEELINYTLPFGHQVRDEDVRAIAAGADIAAVVSRRYPEIADVPGFLEEPRTGLPRLEVELQRYVMGQCRAAFVGNPFHIGLPLAFMVLTDLEIQDLTVLVEAKASGLSQQEFRPLVLRRLAANASATANAR